MIVYSSCLTFQNRSITGPASTAPTDLMVLGQARACRFEFGMNEVQQ